MLKLALIVGSTRPNRFADHPARWVKDRAALQSGVELDVLDLKDQALPFFEEAQSPAMTGGRFTNPAAQAWDAKLASYDGFIATAAEYNHGMTAVLKNALDCAYLGWEGAALSSFDFLNESLRGVFQQLEWWAGAMKSARARAQA